MDTCNVELREVVKPVRDCTGIPVMLTDETMGCRVQKVLAGMHERELEQLVVYCDVEHSGNFAYLAGFFSRFEESLLVIRADGTMSFVLGNENLNKASKARVQASAIHAPVLSLPNQPDAVMRPLDELLREAGLATGARTGVVGWKHFTSPAMDARHTFDVPEFIMAALRSAVGSRGELVAASDIFIGEGGARTTNNANEIAHYEFGASLASDCMLDAMDALELGVTEMQLGDKLVRYGQHTNVVTIAASGPRFVKANMFPTTHAVGLGDTISLTVGYAGGLSSRAGYAVGDSNDMPEGQQSWLDRVAKPYFAAYAHWLRTIRVGLTGGELFDEVERMLPRSEYGWTLCPGHLTAEEEWLSSPVYEGSNEVLRSGMIFQIDIIPSVEGFGGVSAESTVALADESLRDEIRAEYPELWERMQRRRSYLTDVLGIDLSPDALPMCSTVGYLRPYLLDHGRALTVSA